MAQKKTTDVSDKIILPTESKLDDLSIIYFIYQRL